MPGCGEDVHVRPQLGHEHFRRPAVNARDGDHAIDRLSRRLISQADDAAFEAQISPSMASSCSTGA